VFGKTLNLMMLETLSQHMLSHILKERIWLRLLLRGSLLGIDKVG